MGSAQCPGFTLRGSAVGFLVWGLCRLELPSEIFTCFFVSINVFDEGFVISVHILSLHVYFFSSVNAPLI